MDEGRLHWMTALGGVLIVFALMVSLPLMVVPILAESRTLGFWLIVVPLVVAGGALLAYRRYGNQS